MPQDLLQPLDQDLLGLGLPPYSQKLDNACKGGSSRSWPLLNFQSCRAEVGNLRAEARDLELSSFNSHEANEGCHQWHYALGFCHL